MGKIMDPVFLVSAEHRCQNYGRSQRNTNEKIDHQIDQRCAGTDGGNGGVIDELPDDNDIRCIKKQLQYLRKYDRQAVTDQGDENTPVDHVYVVTFR